MKLEIPAALANRIRESAKEGESLDAAACRILNGALRGVKKKTTLDIIKEHLDKVPVGTEFNVLQVMPSQLSHNARERQRYGQALGNAVARGFIKSRYVRMERIGYLRLKLYVKTE